MGGTRAPPLLVISPLLVVFLPSPAPLLRNNPPVGMSSTVSLSSRAWSRTCLSPAPCACVLSCHFHDCHVCVSCVAAANFFPLPLSAAQGHCVLSPHPLPCAHPTWWDQQPQLTLVYPYPEYIIPHHMVVFPCFPCASDNFLVSIHAAQKSKKRQRGVTTHQSGLGSDAWDLPCQQHAPEHENSETVTTSPPQSQAGSHPCSPQCTDMLQDVKE